jgi:glycosyltransferase involved in cell wall biosynthesis
MSILNFHQEQAAEHVRDRLRIAFVISRGDEIGGAHIHVRDLSAALRSRGAEVIVLAGRGGRFPNHLKERGIPIHCIRNLQRSVGPFQAVRAVLEIRQLLRELRPDIVSTHSTSAGVLGRIAACSLGIPALFTAHGWGFTKGHPWTQRFVFWLVEWVAAPLASRIITVCESDFRAAERSCLTRKDRLVAIPNAMPDVQESLRAQPERSPPSIVMVARMASQKDHSTLLRALAQLRDLDWQLELIGDGPLFPALEALAASLGIASRVRFVGYRPDVAERLADGQIFVLASKWEGFPRSILEAMRAGLPVIASDVGGVRESVREGETGFVVPRGDVDVLRDRLRLLIGSPIQRRQMGAAGRAWYEKRFSLERLVAETTAVYDSVLAHP